MEYGCTELIDHSV